MAPLIWSAVTPTPTPTIDPEQVTPGFVGFAAIAILAVAVVFLLIDMLRRVRRGRYRLEIAEQLDEELAQGRDAGEQDAGDVTPVDPAKD
ncbi:hypothetical protein [Microbacterium sp.]|uniref:hypothetical protein n=1 Tax=Microbacterium sp. TaxID=51671 RepID=UPI003A85DEB4